VQETREMLETKEIEVRNLKKDIERLSIELKSLELRFAKIQAQSG
jgi:predicted  nucleic acid-binding Zn-ribbon protein